MKSSKSFAVIGLGFGDEGKGVTVNSLCKNLPNSLVIRYSGGQQAGHTVTLEDGTSHVFSNFGSGTLKGVPTYWSKYCTFDPVGVMNEYVLLRSKGVFSPKLYIDKRSPVTTPYDKYHNQNSKEIMNHGTCGVGVGATFQREEKFYSLLAGDLQYPSVVATKLKLIKAYYGNVDVDIDNFLIACEFINDTFTFVDDVPEYYSNTIFESSQGLLLDQHIGFFPHVTRSNVGSLNILQMGYEPELFLVTRAFQTRHGNGPMTNTDIPNNIKFNPLETNILNKYQGEFKRSLLDLDLLKYGIERDYYISHSKNKSLVITCLDLVQDEFRYTVGGRIVTHLDQESFVRGISEYLGIDKVYTISSPDGTFTLEDSREYHLQKNVAL